MVVTEQFESSFKSFLSNVTQNKWFSAEHIGETWLTVNKNKKKPLFSKTNSGLIKKKYKLPI